ncbi:hypothetical protein BDV98DRAFT_557335 [Pterulicium gracile]|uniref:Uncharacterized protein n=1 Tax=Pterulicium gracile TaxID=1884261 RepID=A0A5C3QYW9_9AGAR|nr:hypothetical protein BDV98DRAFT_557335 [Pterula gracilis]
MPPVSSHLESSPAAVSLESVFICLCLCSRRPSYAESPTVLPSFLDNTNPAPEWQLLSRRSSTSSTYSSVCKSLPVLCPYSKDAGVKSKHMLMPPAP